MGTISIRIIVDVDMYKPECSCSHSSIIPKHLDIIAGSAHDMDT